MTIDPFNDKDDTDTLTETSNQAQQKLRYAGFWIRFVASLIDSVLVMLLIAPLIGMFFKRESEITSTLFKEGDLSAYSLNMVSSLGNMGTLLNMLIPAAVILIFWIYRAATPGKIMLGLKIVDASTLAPLSAGQSFIRYFGYYVSCLFFGLGFIWAGFDPKKQAWHDKLANTLVIYAKK